MPLETSPDEAFWLNVYVDETGTPELDVQKQGAER